MGLVSLAITSEKETITFWLLDEKEKRNAISYLSMIQSDKGTLVGYAVELAEARCVFALGLNPIDFKWQDLMLDWRWLKNGDDRYNYGSVISGLKLIPEIKLSTAPIARTSKKASKVEKEEAAAQNARNAGRLGFNSTASAGGGLLDALVFFGCMTQAELTEESGFKNIMRNHIIAGQGLEGYKDRIIAYNLQDIKKMPELDIAIKKEMRKVLGYDRAVIINQSNLTLCSGVDWDGGEESLSCDLGDWAAQCAFYNSKGLPLNKNRIDKIRQHAQLILNTSKAEFNSQWGWERYTLTSDLIDLPSRIEKTSPTPDDMSDEELISFWRKRVRRKAYPYYKEDWVETTSQFEDWASKYAEDNRIKWSLTESGRLSADREYLESLTDGSEICPIKGYLRQSKEIDSINGLKDGGKLWTKIGEDYIHRPAVDPYSTQTARNGQGASRFLYSAPHWMRTFIEPEKGYCLIDLDFASQEIFIGGALSKDRNLLDSYTVGDPYWRYAQLTGAIPMSLGVPTEEERSQEPFAPYKAIRGQYKGIFLGIGFGLGAVNLARHISKQTGEELEREDGQRFIDEYREAYPEYTAYREALKDFYFDSKRSVYLLDGWRMGNNNPTPNSVLNLPVQGTAGVILRKSCARLDAAGYDIRATMHDAITIYALEANAMEVAADCSKIMAEAATEVLGIEGMRIGNPEIVRNGEIWIHGRGKKDWEKFKKYLQ